MADFPDDASVSFGRRLIAILGEAQGCERGQKNYDNQRFRLHGGLSLCSNILLRKAFTVPCASRGNRRARMIRACRVCRSSRFVSQMKLHPPWMISITGGLRRIYPHPRLSEGFADAAFGAA